MGVFLRFEDDSVESAKQVMQWNVKIINVSKMPYLTSEIDVEEHRGDCPLHDSRVYLLLIFGNSTG